MIRRSPRNLDNPWANDRIICIARRSRDPSRSTLNDQSARLMSRSITRSSNKITGSSASHRLQEGKKPVFLSVHVAILLSRSNRLPPPRVLENKINRRQTRKRDDTIESLVFRRRNAAFSPLVSHPRVAQSCWRTSRENFSGFDRLFLSNEATSFAIYSCFLPLETL